MADDRRDSEEFEQISDRDRADTELNSEDAIGRADDEFEDVDHLDEEDDTDSASDGSE